MSELRDIEIGDSPASAPPPPPRRSSPWPLVIAAVVLAAVLGVIAYFAFFREEAAPPAPEAPPAAEEPRPEAPPEEAEIPEPAPAIELPPLGASDRLVREMVGRLSSHPRLAAWLTPDDLVRRFVAAVDNLAEGKSPASHLPSLEPEGDFEVDHRAGRALLDPESYRRYDPLTEAFVSMDTAGAALLYRQLEPLIDQAYRDLGYPDRDFDDTLARAVGRLLRVPVVEGEIELAPEAVSYRFADPELENLSAASKHLLRFGPRNARRIQAKLRDLAEALEIAPR